MIWLEGLAGYVLAVIVIAVLAGIFEVVIEWRRDRSRSRTAPHDPNVASEEPGAEGADATTVDTERVNRPTDVTRS